MPEIALPHYVGLSLLVLVLGLAVMMVRRNAIGILIGSELIMNAALINFAAFGRFGGESVESQALGVFGIAIAAAEAAIALAIILNFSFAAGTVDVDRGHLLKG